jgi:hypothetical protein
VRLPGGRGPWTVRRIHSRWRVEVDWWRVPLSREYWKLGLRPVDGDDADGGDEPTLVCDLFQDRLGGVWYLTRVYD